MITPGTVYLVGAGPGDPELITVLGLKRLKQADVILYDRLVHPDLLDEAPSRSERIFVGKASGSHEMQQENINRLMVEKARFGQTVVRLKGGDPFVFGRGSEEAAACAEAGIRCEVVPGITSAVGVPANAGIPLTHRGVAGSFTVVTAHRKEGQDDIDWDGLSGVDTLVILMGVERLPHIVKCLIHHGRLLSTPVAIIERGTLPSQRVITGTLKDIVLLARLAQIQPPATIIVGDVVNLTNSMADTRSTDPSSFISLPA